jgi:Transcriptional regulators
MHDVARLAGVSQSTVSLVVNGASRIPPATRQKVHAAIEELGFQPNVAARNLRMRRSNTIGMITDHIVSSPFAGRIVRGAQDLAWEHGYLLLLIDSERDRAIESNAVEALLSRQVDGLLYAAQSWRAVDLPPSFREVPALLINAWPAEENAVQAIVPAEVEGGRIAASAVIEVGHRRVAFFGGPGADPATIERELGFRAAMADANLPVNERWIAYGDYRIHSGFDLAARFWDAGERPTAIVCGNDRMAVGVIAAFLERGVSVPGDVSVVGYDDQEDLAEQFPPTLTTVSIPHYKMGRAAMEILLSTLTEHMPLVGRVVPGELVRRGSVAPPRDVEPRS